MFHHLGENVRRLRFERRLSQAALAARLCPPQRQTDISDIELGRLPCAEARVRQLVTQFAAAFAVPEHQLLKRSHHHRVSAPGDRVDSAPEVAR